MLAIVLFWPKLRVYYVSSPYFLSFRVLVKLRDARVHWRRWDITVLEPMVFFKPKRRWFGRKVKSRSIPRDESAFARAARLNKQRDREEAQAFWDSRRGQTLHIT